MLISCPQVPHNINFREKKSKLKKDKKADSGPTEESSAAKSRIARFRYFEDISGYSGVRTCRTYDYSHILFDHQLTFHVSLLSQVFICGPSPHWMLVTSRGAMRLHPMSIDGSIESFSPFHNINCPKGFLYFNKQVRIVTLVVLVIVKY